jgi:hypothetical protein
LTFWDEGIYYQFRIDSDQFDEAVTNSTLAESCILFIHIYRSRRTFPMTRTTTAPQRGVLASFALLLISMLSAQALAETFDFDGITYYVNPDHNGYFGDLHVHRGYSGDAYVFGTVSSPDDAYRYAKRQALDHPSETFPDSMTLIENAAFFDNSVLTSPVSLRDFGIFSPATFTVTPKLASITYAQGAAGRNDVTFTPSTGPTGSVTAEAAAPPATATPVTVSQLASLGIMAILLSLVTVRKPAS